MPKIDGLKSANKRNKASNLHDLVFKGVKVPKTDLDAFKVFNSLKVQFPKHAIHRILIQKFFQLYNIDNLP